MTALIIVVAVACFGLGIVIEGLAIRGFWSSRGRMIWLVFGAIVLSLALWVTVLLVAGRS